MSRSQAARHDVAGQHVGAVSMMQLLAYPLWLQDLLVTGRPSLLSVVAQKHWRAHPTLRRTSRVQSGITNVSLVVNVFTDALTHLVQRLCECHSVVQVFVSTSDPNSDINFFHGVVQKCVFPKHCEFLYTVVSDLAQACMVTQTALPKSFEH